MGTQIDDAEGRVIKTGASSKARTKQPMIHYPQYIGNSCLGLDRAIYRGCPCEARYVAAEVFAHAGGIGSLPNFKILE